MPATRMPDPRIPGTPADAAPATGDVVARQRPSAMPFGRYQPYHEQFTVDLPDRQWPARPIEAAPRSCAVDLRHGNPALIHPISPQRNRRMFSPLVQIRYNAADAGFPPPPPPN